MPYYITVQKYVKCSISFLKNSEINARLDAVEREEERERERERDKKGGKSIE